MAKKVELEFEAAGSLFDDLRALGQAVGQLRTETGKATDGIQADLKDSAKDAQQFSKAVEGGTKVVTALGKAVAASNTGGFVKGIDAATASTKGLEASVKGVSDQTTKASDNLEAIAASARTASTSGKASLTSLGATAVKSQQEIAKSVKLTAAEYDAIREEVRAVGIESEEFVAAIAEAVQELAAAGVEAEDLSADFKQVNDPVVSLQRQLRAAKLEAGALAAEFGLDSEEALKAQQRVAALTDEVGDLTARFDAFNPDKKFEAFNQLQFSLVAGLSAVQQSVGLLAGDNEGLQKVIFGFQSLLFATQSLQQFTGGFGDALKTLRATLGLTSTATAAQTAATVASGTATAAAGAAAGASATGWAAATAGVKAFTLSLLTNPIFLIVAALGALAIAVATSGDDAEKAMKQWDDLFDSLNQFRGISDQTIDLDKQLTDLDIARQRIAASEGDFATARRLVQDSANAEIEAINAKAAARRKDAAELQRALDVLIATGDLTTEEIRDRQQQIDGILAEASNSYSQTLVVRRAAENELAQIEKEALERAKENAQQRKALNDELVQAAKDLARRLLDAQREAAGQDDPFERVRIERQVAQEEVDELEKGFKRRLAEIELQKRLGVQAWQDLSEAEKEARADAFIDQAGIELPAAQLEQVNALRLLANEKYLKAVDELVQEQARLRIELIEDNNERERKIFIDDLNKRLDALRKAKLDESEIERFAVAERARFDREVALARVALDEQIQTARVNALQNQGEPEKVFARRKELELLAIKEASANAQLKIIEGQTGKEAELVRANLAVILAEIARARAELSNNPVKLDLLDLLGVKEADKARVQGAFAEIFAATQEIIAAGLEAQQAEVDARIAATDQIIADAQRRRSELTGELERELQAQREGYANNSDAIRAEIDAVNQAERDATAQRKVAIAERQQIARKQVAIDAVTQAAALATSSANLIASFSTLPFGVGLIAAFAQIASIYAFFAKVRAQSRAASQPDQFEDGGWVGGKRHSQGGTVIEAERDEFVVNRKSAGKYAPVIEAINDDDLASLRPPDLKAFLGAMGIRMSDEAVKDVADTHRNERAINLTGGNLKTDRLEQRVVELTNEVKALRADAKAKEEETILPDGTRITKRKGVTTIIRKRKP
jgi:hypothetical protein